jgi:VanZ family protein
LNREKRIFKDGSLYFLIVILFLILFFGLRPKDYNFLNCVTWITDQAGIHLKKYGIVYTNLIIGKKETDFSVSNNFSLEIALKPTKPSIDGFSFIVVHHDGNDGNQLLMAQWRSWIIFMNGDDYAHKRKTNRIAVDTALLPDGPLFITITSNTNGTKLYCNGKLLKENQTLKLTMPNGRKSRILVGNSLYGNNSWEGDIFGLAIYRETLNSKDIDLHFENWSKEHNFSFAKNDKPFVLYFFDEKEGKLALDHAGKNHHLKIPDRMKILKKKILELEWEKYKYDSNHIQDFLLNLLGFIPLGFSLSATLIRFRGKFIQHVVLKTVFSCFIFSLFIEIFQAWIPSRSSSMLDLILNTCGALIGSIIFYKVLAKKPYKMNWFCLPHQL